VLSTLRREDLKQAQPTPLPLPKRLREARERNGISQMNLGIKAGMDPSSASSRINHYEQGRHAPDFQIAAQLADCLGVPVTYFYATDDRMAALILRFSTLTATGQKELLASLE